MPTAPVEPTDLPPYRHRGPCPRCGGRGPIRVHFDRDCREVLGEIKAHRSNDPAIGYNRWPKLKA